MQRHEWLLVGCSSQQDVTKLELGAEKLFCALIRKDSFTGRWQCTSLIINEYEAS